MRRKNLVVWLLLAFSLGISGCDWSTDADFNTTQAASFDVSGVYTLSLGEVPWDDLMIWQTGQTLRAQDSRGLFWEGTVGGAGTGADLNWEWQVFLQCENQHSGLTEWLRGRIGPVETLLGTFVLFEGIYTRSDNAETSVFEAEAIFNPNQWPGFGDDVTE